MIVARLPLPLLSVVSCRPAVGVNYSAAAMVHAAAERPIHRRRSLSLHSCIPACLCYLHQWLIVDLLSSVITCPFNCPLPSLVICCLLHHLPSLHRSHRRLGQPLIGQLQHKYQLLQRHHVEEGLNGQHVSKVRVAWCNSLAGWPFLVPLVPRQLGCIFLFSEIYFLDQKTRSRQDS